MALTKIGKEGITGIDNSSDATAITITSAELVGIGTTSPSAQLHISGTDTSDQVIIENTDTGGGSAPDLVLFRNSSSPADNDVIGRIDFRGDDDNGTARDYVTLFSTITDASTGTPAGSFAIQTRNGSNQTTRFIVNGSGDIGIGASNNSSYDANARNVLIADESGSSGLTIRSGGSSTYGMIHFADGVSSAAEYRAGRIIYEHSSDSMQFSTANTQNLVIDGTGAVTKPNQPAFLVRPSGSITNVALNTGQVVAFDTEVFDQNADFASNVFTAPVTGRYLLNYSLYVVSLDSAANFYESYLQTSNRIYYCTIDPDYGQDNTYFTFNLTVLADMDANDTADVKFYQSAGTQQTDIGASSHFAGHLAC